MFGLFKRKKTPEILEQEYSDSVSSFWLKLKSMLILYDAEYEYTVSTRFSRLGHSYFTDNHTADTDIEKLLQSISKKNKIEAWRLANAPEVLQDVALFAVCLKECVSPVIEEHILTLTRKRKSLLITDDYGNLNLNKWDKEIEYFYLTTLETRVSDWYHTRIPQLMDEFSLDKPGTLRNELYILRNRTREDICMCLDSLMTKIITSNDIYPEPDTYQSSFSGHEYEHFVSELIESSGFSAQVTRGSGDHGADIIAEYRDLRIAIQCKHYNDKVGNKAVQEVYSAMSYYDCNASLVVTNNTFTPHAQQAAAKLEVALLHHDQLKDFLAGVIGKISLL